MGALPQAHRVRHSISLGSRSGRERGTVGRTRAAIMARATLGRCTGPYLGNGVILWLIRYFYHARMARARHTPWANRVHILRLPPLPTAVSHMLQHMSSVIRLLRTARYRQLTLIGTRRWRTGITSGRWASRLLKLWTLPTVVWDWTGR